ncbi:MAG: iron-containing alcohol dehydrogenase [Deltaproteobacteria bacterium]|nr:iron-containing alcohol dehydrogenase [Deltaproteobacteria bacterium]
MTIFDFRLATQLVHGPGSIARLPEFFSGKKKLLIVTDKGLVQAGVVDRVTAVLDRAGIPHSVFDGVLANPIASCVNAGHRQYTREKCDVIVGVGGGSPMDVAKMIGVLAANGGRIDQYLIPSKVERDLPTLACVPTTYGTASEVTPFAVLTDPQDQRHRTHGQGRDAERQHHRQPAKNTPEGSGRNPQEGHLTGCSSPTLSLLDYTVKRFTFDKSI